MTKRQSEKTFRKNNIESSKSYWIERYQEFGDSGNGKLPIRIRYKAKILNSILSNYKSRSVIDIGCGEGKLSKLLKIENYVGIEISETLVEKLNSSNTQDKGTHKFYFDSQIPNLVLVHNFDTAMSIDVIFHLLEDEEYFRHLKLLFSDTRADIVVIRSTLIDRVGRGRNAHIRHRSILADIKRNYPDFKLVKTIRPPIPFWSPSISDTASFLVFSRVH